MSIQSVGASAGQYTPPVQISAGTGTARPVDASLEAGKTQAAKDTSQTAKAAPPSSEQLNQAVKQIQDVIEKTANSLQFSIDEDLGVSIVKVIDTESKKTIRQIPTEEVLDIAKALDKLQGLLIKQRA